MQVLIQQEIVLNLGFLEKNNKMIVPFSEKNKMII